MDKLRPIIVALAIGVITITITEYRSMMLSQTFGSQLSRIQERLSRMEQRTNSKVAAGPASALAETGPSALAETMAYVQKQRLDSVEDLDTAVAPCTPKPGSKRVCMDYAYQMLCELDILARRRGDVVFLQSGTLLQVLRDGKLREDDDDIDVGYIDYKPRGFEDKIHPLKGTHYTDMCRIGYYEEEGVGGMVISPGHELVEKRFNNSGGGPSLPECLTGTTYLSKIEFWPYIAIDASSTAIYYPPPSLAPESDCTTVAREVPPSGQKKGYAPRATSITMSVSCMRL